MGQALLIHCPPEIVLFAIDLDEDFVDVESVAVATVSVFQSACIDRSEFFAPESDGLSADRYSPFSQEILDVTLT